MKRRKDVTTEAAEAAAVAAAAAAAMPVNWVTVVVWTIDSRRQRRDLPDVSTFVCLRQFPLATNHFITKQSYLSV